MGINVKGVSLDAKGSETTSDQTRQETLEAIVGSVFAEYKIMDLFSIGVEMIPYDIESETVTNNRDGETVDTGNSTVQVDLESNVGVYLMIPLGDQGVYVKGGYTHSDVITNENMNTGTKYGSRSEEHTLNSSHTVISYAVFCLKKKKKKKERKTKRNKKKTKQK